MVGKRNPSTSGANLLREIAVRLFVLCWVLIGIALVLQALTTGIWAVILLPVIAAVLLAMFRLICFIFDRLE